MRQFSQIYNIVIALDYPQNFVSAQYLGTWNLTKFCICIDVDQIMLGLFASMLASMQQSYDPWLLLKLHFHSISYL